MTHTDPKAEEGALVIAQAARWAARHPSASPIDLLTQFCRDIKGEELRNALTAAVTSLEKGLSPVEYAESQGWSKGVSGYVNRTVPAALYCWAASDDVYRTCIETAVGLGGDTDSVAAIAGAVSGASVGYRGIPQEWIHQISEWPHTIEWNERLARTLAEVTRTGQPQVPPPMYWPATILRNIAFASIVIGIGFRRLLPPYHYSVKLILPC